ncbi:MAG: SufD family Fe-S cluster assembly protein [Candidatus Sungbacteria bacterium]|nr:SufD family Fe-S cluster assembly protein [Candidatus Sungbacteria bacterium]
MEIRHSKNLENDFRQEICLPENGRQFAECLIFADQMPKTFDLTIRLLGRASRAELVILYLGGNKDEADMKITLAHEAPETYGRVVIKAALFDESRLTVRGMLEIAPNARGADSYLLAKALLVSPHARAEIYPYLEIATDEVKASHGTSVGRIDEKQLFYLQSRGVEQDKAKELLLAGFFRDLAKDFSRKDQEKFFQYAAEQL